MSTIRSAGLGLRGPRPRHLPEYPVEMVRHRRHPVPWHRQAARNRHTISGCGVGAIRSRRVGASGMWAAGFAASRLRLGRYCLDGALRFTGKSYCRSYRLFANRVVAIALIYRIWSAESKSDVLLSASDGTFWMLFPCSFVAGYSRAFFIGICCRIVALTYGIRSPGSRIAPVRTA